MRALHAKVLWLPPQTPSGLRGARQRSAENNLSFMSDLILITTPLCVCASRWAWTREAAVSCACVSVWIGVRKEKSCKCGFPEPKQQSFLFTLLRKLCVPVWRMRWDARFALDVTRVLCIYHVSDSVLIYRIECNACTLMITNWETTLLLFLLHTTRLEYHSTTYR